MSGLTSPCCCGGLTVASASWAVMDAVGRHNATPEHRAWRRRADQAEATAAYRARMRAHLAERRMLLQLLAENPEVAA